MTREGKAYTLPSKAWLAELADIADIRPDSLHPDHVEYFYIEAVSLLKEQWRNADRRTSNPAVLDAQKKILAALQAVKKLTDLEQECLGRSYAVREFPFADIAVWKWDPILGTMSDALADLTGKDLGPGHGRGRPKYKVANLPLHQLVENLLCSVARYGGRLTFDAKNGGSGSLVKALNHLRPVLPPGLVPKVLPLKTIERMGAAKLIRDAKNGGSGSLFKALGWQN
jgi:hypothetical protein